MAVAPPGGTGRRVLVATFGSAGDLFPLVPMLRRLVDDGCEVRVATGRTTGLYLRTLGVPTVALGDGTELRVLGDPSTIRTRFDGWASWRRTVLGYVAPTLPGDVAVLGSVIDDWAPEVVVTSGFAAAARIAAHRAGVPAVEVTIYPQHARLATAGRRFAPRYADLVAELAGLAPGDPAVSRLAWGAPAGVLLHDRALLGAEPAAEPVGFPSWDDMAGRGDDAEAADRWLADGEPTVLVTLGSFLGSAQEAAWRTAADAVAALGVRGLLVGARAPWAQEAFASRTDVLCTGFVPLSRYLPAAAAVVHHGGIGTTFATLRARRPAVVLPQAFDQAFNARLVERAGAGFDGSARSLPEALAAVLAPEAEERVGAVADRLVPAEAAAATTVEAVLAGATRPGGGRHGG